MIYLTIGALAVTLGLLAALVWVVKVLVQTLTQSHTQFAAEIKTIHEQTATERSEYATTLSTNLTSAITSAVNAIGEVAYGKSGDRDNAQTAGIIDNDPTTYNPGFTDDWTDGLVPDVERENVATIKPGQPIPGIMVDGQIGAGLDYPRESALPSMPLPQPNLAGEEWTP